MVSAASLLFRAGERPVASEIRALAERQRGFSISLDPESEGQRDEGWIELVSSGLTFDLVGLAPNTASDLPQCTHFYGFPDAWSMAEYEAITIMPGPHLAGGETMFPVVRCLAMLVAQLTRMDRVRAVAWHPARTCSEATYYREEVISWAEGGAFPGLGLAALSTDPDGTTWSEGLALFTGQELRLPADLAEDRAQIAKIALRLLNWLVEHGPIDEAITFTGPDGELLGLEPLESSGILRVWRGAL